MTRFGLDSTSEVSPAAHHAVGSTVALRYLSRSTYKVVTRGEHKNYQDRGIDLCLVFEDSATNALGGYSQGKADAQFAESQALATLGPPPRPHRIAFAVDYDPNGGESRTDGYFEGCAAVLGKDRCGPYGGIGIIRHCASRGFRHLWQTYAWSGGQYDNRAALYQYSNSHTVGGVGVDFNHIYGVDFGQVDFKNPPPVDPHGFHLLSKGPFPSPFGMLSEVDVAQHYYGAMQHASKFVDYITLLRAEARFLANRIAFLVIDDSNKAAYPTPRNWLYANRGERYQILIKIYKGQKF